jgi:hypothetical protein
MVCIPRILPNICWKFELDLSLSATGPKGCIEFARKMTARRILPLCDTLGFVSFFPRRSVPYSGATERSSTMSLKKNNVATNNPVLGTGAIVVDRRCLEKY